MQRRFKQSPVSNRCVFTKNFYFMAEPLYRFLLLRVDETAHMVVSQLYILVLRITPAYVLFLALRGGGMQLVGKLQGTRRNPPPPPWVPSIKAEMGGHDTRVNIVPPGGSGWGTSPSTNTASDAASKGDAKAKPTSPSILKDITDKDNDESKPTLCSDSSMALVKPCCF